MVFARVYMFQINIMLTEFVVFLLMHRRHSKTTGLRLSDELRGCFVPVSTVLGDALML